MNFDVILAFTLIGLYAAFILFIVFVILKIALAIFCTPKTQDERTTTAKFVSSVISVTNSPSNDDFFT